VDVLRFGQALSFLYFGQPIEGTRYSQFENHREHCRSALHDVLQDVGQNPNDGSRKKGGIKVYALINAFNGIVEFSKITAAKEHDKKFMAHLKLAHTSFIFF